MTSKLRGKQREFVNQYFMCGYNGTRAAEAAGYKGDDATLAATASRLLRNDKVAAEVKRRYEERAMPSYEVLARLGDVARGDISEFIDDSGKIDFAKVRARGYLVKRVAHHKGSKSTIELHDALTALIHLDKAHGGEDGKPIEQRLVIEMRGNVGPTDL